VVRMSGSESRSGSISSLISCKQRTFSEAVDRAIADERARMMSSSRSLNEEVTDSAIRLYVMTVASTGDSRP
jgi:hypothetical protein